MIRTMVDHWLSDSAPDEMLLFQYTNDKLWKILETGSLRMSPYASTNDPRETKAWVEEVIMAAGGVIDAALRHAEEIQREADRILRRGARMACFTLDRAADPDAEPGTLFHRGWARARMWSQIHESAH